MMLLLMAVTRNLKVWATAWDWAVVAVTAAAAFWASTLA
jgi:hypothetical protein